MKEVHESGKADTYCMGKANASPVQSQAESNHANPITRPKDIGNSQENQKAHFMGTMKYQGTHMHSHATPGGIENTITSISN